MLFRFLVALAIACMPIIAYSNCHNTEDCEDVSQVTGFIYWDEPNGNVVNYLVNTTYNPNNKPSLSPDVIGAGSTWSGLEYDDNDIEFSAVCNGTTTAKAGTVDNQNVVSWKGFPDGEDDDLAYADITIWPNQGMRIKEIDILFNYYQPFDQHGNVGTGEHCIANVAAHEFGHFAGLRDVYYDPEREENSTNCSQYTEYTMFGYASTFEHKKETLECEDIYALYLHYLLNN